MLIVATMSFVYAGGITKIILPWYKQTLPSQMIDTASVDTLTIGNQYVWNTTQYWKDGQCYYFDLYVGNETNVTWQDTRRELTCGKVDLSADEVDKLELNNVAWTLDQLGMSAQPSAPVIKTDALKGENIKKAQVEVGLDNMQSVDIQQQDVVIS